MPQILLHLDEELAQQFREFAVRETKSSRGMSGIAAAALIEYMERRKAEGVG